MEKGKPKDPDPKFSHRIMSGNITLDDFYQLLKEMKEMGYFNQILTQIGDGNISDDIKRDAEKKLVQWADLIQSMTKEERENPKILKKSRKKRIALGAGVEYSELIRMLDQYLQIKRMMKRAIHGGVPKLREKILSLMKDRTTDTITIERKYLSEFVESKLLIIDQTSGLPMLKNHIKKYLDSNNITIQYTTELIIFKKNKNE
jgi:signal recognition particle GTPase